MKSVHEETDVLAKINYFLATSRRETNLIIDKLYA